MILQNRIELVSRLGDFMNQNDDEWKNTIHRASIENPWFTEEFINLALSNIVKEFLNQDKLSSWASHYHLDDNIHPKTIGVVMAGNIPMVGFHDFLCIFISGHNQKIKLSGKDDVLFKSVFEKLLSWDSRIGEKVSLSDQLKGCDAYIATGSNNTALYFEQYFGKYPNIIRKNRTSVAVLDGSESVAELELLSADIHSFFGLGCRNVTKIFVPEGYDFIPLLKSFDTYKHLRDHHRYQNNYDYQLSILLINGKHYMTNGTTLLTEQTSFFSPISTVNYEYYSKKDVLIQHLKANPEVQCIVGRNETPFGKAQQPDLFTYADGVDTLQFLLTL
jgi:hypothetical protein